MAFVSSYSFVKIQEFHEVFRVGMISGELLLSQYFYSSGKNVYVNNRLKKGSFSPLGMNSYSSSVKWFREKRVGEGIDKLAQFAKRYSSELKSSLESEKPEYFKVINFTRYVTDKPDVSKWPDHYYIFCVNYLDADPCYICSNDLPDTPVIQENDYLVTAHNIGDEVGKLNFPYRGIYTLGGTNNGRLCYWSHKHGTNIYRLIEQIPLKANDVCFFHPSWYMHHPHAHVLPYQEFRIGQVTFEAFQYYIASTLLTMYADIGSTSDPDVLKYLFKDILHELPLPLSMSVSRLGDKDFLLLAILALVLDGFIPTTIRPLLKSSKTETRRNWRFIYAELSNMKDCFIFIFLRRNAMLNVCPISCRVFDAQKKRAPETMKFFKFMPLQVVDLPIPYFHTPSEKMLQSSVAVYFTLRYTDIIGSCWQKMLNGSEQCIALYGDGSYIYLYKLDTELETRGLPIVDATYEGISLASRVIRVGGTYVNFMPYV